MKKIAAIILAGAAVATVGCQKIEADDSSEEPMFVLGADMPSATKTYVDGTDNTKINWSSSDVLGVWGDDNYAFTLMSGAGSSSAQFCGAITGSAVAALYPYNENATYDSPAGTISTLVPCLQKSDEGSFDPAAALMVGQVDTKGRISFHNAVAYVKIKIPSGGSPIKSVTLTSNDRKKYLSGSIVINTADGSSTMGVSKYWSVEISDASGSSMTAGGEYYAAIIADSYDTGITITYTYSDGSALQKTKTDALSVAKGHVKTVGTVDMSSGATKVRGVDNNHCWVDLGLKSKTKWATRNVGAAADYGWEAIGDYYAWGATEPWYTSKTVTYMKITLSGFRSGKEKGYLWSNAPYYTGDGTAHSFSKYGAGEQLDVSDDAAQVNWGGKWLTPSGIQTGYLVNQCYFRYVSNYRNSGVGGYVVYKAADSSDAKQVTCQGGTPIDGYSDAEPCSIFLPNTGYANGTGVYSLYSDSFLGFYWSSAVTSTVHYAGAMYMTNTSRSSFIWRYRYQGAQIRPVILAD